MFDFMLLLSILHKKINILKLINFKNTCIYFISLEHIETRPLGASGHPDRLL